MNYDEIGSDREKGVSMKCARLLNDIRKLIEDARRAVATTVNIGMTMLYWRVGKRINEEILKGKRADYGKQILATLSQQLRRSHFRELLPLDKPLQRDFYAEMCRVEGWNVRVHAKCWKSGYIRLSQAHGND